VRCNLTAQTLDANHRRVPTVHSDLNRFSVPERACPRRLSSQYGKGRLQADDLRGKRTDRSPKKNMENEKATVKRIGRFFALPDFRRTQAEPAAPSIKL